MNSEKAKAYFLLALVAVVALSFLVYFLNIKSLGFDEIPLMVVALLLLSAAAYFFLDRFRSVRAGLRAEDEFSRKVMHKAGYYAFLGTIWAALFIGFFEDSLAELFGLEALEVHHVTGMVILVSAVIFFAAFFCLKSRGDAQ